MVFSKLHSDKHIEVELDLDELDLTSFESKATYEQIKQYVLENTGMKVSTLSIAQTKQNTESSNVKIIIKQNLKMPKLENVQKRRKKQSRMRSDILG